MFHIQPEKDEPGGDQPIPCGNLNILEWIMCWLKGAPAPPVQPPGPPTDAGSQSQTPGLVGQSDDPPADIP